MHPIERGTDDIIKLIFHETMLFNIEAWRIDIFQGNTLLFELYENEDIC